MPDIQHSLSRFTKLISYVLRDAQGCPVTRVPVYRADCIVFGLCPEPSRISQLDCRPGMLLLNDLEVCMIFRESLEHPASCQSDQA